MSRDYELGLKSTSDEPIATVIISVYRDAEALSAILIALSRQTVKNFEIIVSEDGDSHSIRQLLVPWVKNNSSLCHLTQDDVGFRKNRALNSATRKAKGVRLIFIDGDCVPHTRFVEGHLAYTDPKIVCSGRRVELGVSFSKKLREDPYLIKSLSNPLKYFLALPQLIFDGVKNPESGVYSAWLQKIRDGVGASLVGCNFSCGKDALEAVNGFNEEYQAAGIGEDTDLQWRLEQAGYKIRSVKFITPIFHLYHPRTYTESEQNKQLFEQTVREQRIQSALGLRER